MGYGVIGSPTGSGPVSLGSSPGTPAICNHSVKTAARSPKRAAALFAGWALLAAWQWSLGNRGAAPFGAGKRRALT